WRQEWRPSDGQRYRSRLSVRRQPHGRRVVPPHARPASSVDAVVARIGRSIHPHRNRLAARPSRMALCRMASRDPDDGNGAMDEIRIRQAVLSDLPDLLHHRRAMFSEMGSRDEAVLNRMEQGSAEYLRAAIPKGQYLGWVAETTSGGCIVAGGGIAIVPWPGSP